MRRAAVLRALVVALAALVPALAARASLIDIEDEVMCVLDVRLRLAGGAARMSP